MHELLDACHQFEMQSEKLRQERLRTRKLEAEAKAVERKARRDSLQPYLRRASRHRTPK
jgi:hypothetical protein